MKKFRRNVMLILFVFLLLWVGVNGYLYYQFHSTNQDKFYKVEENRILEQLKNGVEDVDLSTYKDIVDVDILDVGTLDINIQDANIEQFFPNNQTSVDYQTLSINGQVKIIKFCYRQENNQEFYQFLFVVNGILVVIFAFLVSIFLYLGRNIIKPFHTLRNLPEELSKGTLTKAIPESKNKFFGRFTWGLDLLRQKLEAQKLKELQLEKEKKLLILSISHDIKTPLSAIKLYVKALKEHLYDTEEKKQEVLVNIQRNAEEIEHFVGEIIRTSTTDFLKIEVKEKEEYYLKDLMDSIQDYYIEMMKLKFINFQVADYDNCILKGDKNRTIEVLQNVIENAIKYGDGKDITIDIEEEENCKLITVSNSGNTLPETELVHVFESFYRGSNVKDKKGNGLGLYICKEIMNQMNGEIFAQIKDGWMRITLVILM